MYYQVVENTGLVAEPCLTLKHYTTNLRKGWAPYSSENILIFYEFFEEKVSSKFEI